MRKIFRIKRCPDLDGLYFYGEILLGVKMTAILLPHYGRTAVRHIAVRQPVNLSNASRTVDG
jgi:hypothetical protein